MIKKIVFILLGTISFSAISKAQEARFKYGTYSSVGFLAGASPVAFTAETVHGIHLRSWYAGVGIGRDNYGLHTWPLFADVKKNFDLPGGQLFLFADAGGQLNGTPIEKSDFQIITITPGLYASGGMGYSITLHKKSSLYFQIGYSHKRVQQQEKSTDTGWNWENITLHRYSRIRFSVGLHL